MERQRNVAVYGKKVSVLMRRTGWPKIQYERELIHTRADQSFVLEGVIHLYLSSFILLKRYAVTRYSSRTDYSVETTRKLLRSTLH